MSLPGTFTREQLDALIERADAADAARAAMMPTERDALLVLNEAVRRLKELGWREAIYAPRDGRALQLIEPGSTGIHTGYCRERPASGLPMKWFWIWDDDEWPSNPILYREAPKT